MHFIKNLQKQARNFFGISTTEANALIIILPLLSIAFLLFPFYHHLFSSPEPDFEKDKKELQQFIAILERSNKKHELNHPKKKIISQLNPNEAPFTDLISIGLDTILAARIISYRSAGGHFYLKNDIKKIYGLNDSIYRSIESVIFVPHQKAQKTSVISKASNISEIPQQIEYNEPKPVRSFNINVIDSIDLQKLKGIGPVLSSRIIKYRKLLGGFIDTTQLKEVYGLSPEVIKQLNSLSVIDKNFVPEKININTSDASALAKHPYISWKIANAMVNYRKQHGPFKNLDTLKEIVIMDDATLAKITPYLSM